MRTVTKTQTEVATDAAEPSAGDDRRIDETVSQEVHDVIRDHPWLGTVTRLGWLAKAVVYALMGVAAVSIARSSSNPAGADQEASPQGAIDTIRDTAAGRIMLAVLAMGLVLYVMWRLLSVAVLRGGDLRKWLTRIGYTFSACFYTVLAWTAAGAAVRGSDPGRSSTIEDVSASVLSATAGRWLLGVAGLVTIAVGLVFVVEQGARRGFRKDLRLYDADDAERTLLDATGVIGWVGRGVVTLLVGLFVLRAAVEFDPAEARGFDLALREVADRTLGSWLVLLTGIGLVVYAVFCAVSARRQMLRS